MGVVLLASERVLDRMVAIKVLHRHAAEQDELRERFRREARVAARLAHANIVPLHAFGEVDGELFFVMGFVEGETLAARLKREGRLSQDAALGILREVCDALAFAHASGVIHRDIKPENVLIEARTGRALLADFGIAREGTAGTALTGTGIVVGTPHYMSPEQATSDGMVDHRADLYAVGVMGYRMLSGRLPFDGANVREILAQQMIATPRDLGTSDSTLSPQVAAAIMRCLEKDPQKRWSDAAMLRAAIVPPQEGIEDLPDDLTDLDGLGWKAAVLSLSATWLWVLNTFWWLNEDLGGFISLPIFGAPFAAMLLCFNAARKHGLRRPMQLMSRAPKWWAGWWPRFGRRPGDVWDRLPRALRVARSVLFGSVAIGGPVVASQILLMLTLPSERLAVLLANPYLKPASVAMALAMAVSIYGTAIIVHLWWRKVGKVAVPGRPPWLGEPTSSPRWKRPELAQFLLPVRSVTARVPESVERLGDAIGVGVRSLVADGVIPSAVPSAVARDVVSAIAAIDAELAMLAKGGDEAELHRLDERIAALPSGGAGAGIADMLNRQRDAVAAIVRRQHEQHERRERLVARLRELFVALDDIRRRAGDGPAPDVTGRLEEVCSDLRRLAAGYDELHDSATTPIGN